MQTNQRENQRICETMEIYEQSFFCFTEYDLIEAYAKKKKFNRALAADGV
jgi:hypothetical protein